MKLYVGKNAQRTPETLDDSVGRKAPGAIQGPITQTKTKRTHANRRKSLS